MPTGHEPTLDEYLRAVAPGTQLAAYLETLETHRALESELASLAEAEADGGSGESDGLAGYELREEIHRGGQGVVHRALQRSTKRVVAVKLLHDGAMLSPRRMRRFEREVELVAALDHPNIATVHDSGVAADGRPFLVMEYVDGVPVDAALRREGQPDEASTEELLRLFVKVCRAVHHAHQRGVLHRDLKPGNILVDAAGEPHVLDFGLAVAVEEEVAGERSRLTRTGEFMGTLAYASPEHVSGVPHEVDLRSDVYSLGVILYELLTGRAPYDLSGPVVDVVRAILESPPRPPTTCRRADSRSGTHVARALAGVDRELDVVVATALAKDKARRYQSAGELARDVERYLAGEPILARSESTWYVLRKTLNRHKVGALTALCIVAALATATVVSAFALERARRQAQKAEEIADYLRSTLDSITPDQAKGRTVTVRHLLDDAARRLDAGDFSSREARFELTRTVARTYRLLSAFGAASDLYRRAEDLALPLFGERSLERADLLVGRGTCERETGRFQEAERCFREAASIADELLDAPSGGSGLDPVAVRGAACHGLGSAACYLGDYQGAQQWFERAEADLVAAEGAGSGAVAELLHSQAVLLQRRGEYAAAEARLSRSLGIWAARGDEDVTGVAKDEQVLGEVARARGDERAAREHFARALERSRRLHGDGSPTTMRLREEIAISDLRLEGHAAVEDEYRALLALRDTIRGSDVGAASALNNLGVLAQALADYATAEELFREALELYTDMFAEDTFERNNVRANLGWCLIRQGRMAEARAMCAHAIETVSRLLGPGTRWEGSYRAQIAWTHLDAGDSARAVEEASAALDILRACHPPAHPRIAQQLLELGLFRFAQGDMEGAEDLFREALALSLERGGDPTAELATAEHLIGEVCLNLGRHEEAAGHLTRGLELRRRLLPARHPDLAESLNTTAMNRYLMGDRSLQTQGMWHEALEILRAQKTPYPRMTYVLGNLGAWEFAVTEDLDAAADLYDQAIAHAEATSASNYPLFGHVLAGRAAVHGRRGEHAQAAELLERAYEQMTRDPNAVLATTPQVLGMLVNACEKSGDLDRAARYGELLQGG